MTVALELVDSLITNRQPGAARRAGSHPHQSLSIRCPGCAKISMLPIFPNVGSSGATFSVELDMGGMSLAEPVSLVCCGWTGRLVHNQFVSREELDQAQEPGEGPVA